MNHKILSSAILATAVTLFGCDSGTKANSTVEDANTAKVETITTAQEASGAPKILPYKIHQTVLPNGLTIVTVPFDSPGTAAFYTVFRVGSRDEIEEGVTGFAHFFEHMMFRGTDKYSKEQYSAILKSTGASANANTTTDRTLYYMTGDVAKLDTMFDIESDRLRHLKYSEHDFKTEAGAVKGEYTKNAASPYGQLMEKMQFAAYTKHTYQHMTMGFLKDIVDMPNQYEYSLKFKDRFYRPEYATVIVVGDVTPEQVLTLSKKYFGDWKRGSYKSVVPVEPAQEETRFVHLQNDSIPPYMTLQFKGPAFTAEEIDVPALDILGSLLFSSTSPLYKKIVLDERKARGINGGINDKRDPGLFTINASMYSAEDMQYVKDEIYKTLADFKENGVDEQELKNIKSRLKYSFAMRIDNPSEIARVLTSYIQLTGDPEAINKLYVQYDSVTMDDLKTMVNKYFNDKSLTIGTISGEEKGNVK